MCMHSFQAMGHKRNRKFIHHNPQEFQKSYKNTNFLEECVYLSAFGMCAQRQSSTACFFSLSHCFVLFEEFMGLAQRRRRREKTIQRHNYGVLFMSQWCRMWENERENFMILNEIEYKNNKMLCHYGRRQKLSQPPHKIGIVIVWMPILIKCFNSNN